MDKGPPMAEEADDDDSQFLEATASTLSCQRLLAASYNNAGVFLHRQNRMAEAIVMYKDAARVRMESIDPKNAADDGSRPEVAANYEELVALCRNAIQREKDLMRTSPPENTCPPVFLFSEVDGLPQRAVQRHSRPLLVPNSTLLLPATFERIRQDSAITLYNMGLWHHQAATAATAEEDSGLAGSLESASALLRMCLDVCPRPPWMESGNNGDAAISEGITDYEMLARGDGVAPFASAEAHGFDVSTLALNNLGMLQLKSGRPQEALRYLGLAYSHISMPLATKATARQPPQREPAPPSCEAAMMTLFNLSQVHRSLNQHGLSASATAAVLWMMSNIGTDFPSSMEENEMAFLEGKAMLLHNLASSFHASCDLAQAHHLYTALLSNIRSLEDSETTNLLRSIEADALRCLGTVQSDSGNPEQAVETFLEAMRVHDSHNQNTSRDFPFVTSTLMGLGWAYLKSGEPSKSIEVFREALSVAHEGFGPDHVRVTGVLCTLGKVCRILDNPGAALTCYEQALDGVRRRLAGLARMTTHSASEETDDKTLLMDLLWVVGAIHLEGGDVGRAETAFAEATMVEGETASRGGRLVSVPLELDDGNNPAPAA